MRQVTGRTLRRAARRERLWNGNREPLTNFYRWDPEKNIIRWAWVHHPRYRSIYRTAATDGSWHDKTVVFIESHAASDAWLATLPPR